MRELSAYIEKQCELNEEEWQLIVSHVEIRELPANEFFIQSGKVCRYSGIILEGVMRYFEANEAGAEPTCYFSFEGHYIVDPFTFRDQRPSSINLKSVTGCRLAVISFEQDRQLAAMLPKWREITTTMLLDISVEFANQKTMMSLNASQRYTYFLEHYPDLALRVPLQYIASYLGMTQPSLSRLRANLRKRSG